MAKAIRIPVPFKHEEKNEIEEFSTKKAIPRNELIRRATLAYVRSQENEDECICEHFSEVGFLDEVEE